VELAFSWLGERLLICSVQNLTKSDKANAELLFLIHIFIEQLVYQYWLRCGFRISHNAVVTVLSSIVWSVKLYILNSGGQFSVKFRVLLFGCVCPSHFTYVTVIIFRLICSVCNARSFRECPSSFAASPLDSEKMGFKGAGVWTQFLSLLFRCLSRTFVYNQIHWLLARVTLCFDCCGARRDASYSHIFPYPLRCVWCVNVFKT